MRGAYKIRRRPRPGRSHGERGESGGRDQRAEAMLKMARELAAHCHRVQMTEAMLAANYYPEAAEFIDQPHIHSELRHCPQPRKA